MAPPFHAIMVSSGENITDIDEYTDRLSQGNAENWDFFVKLDEKSRPLFIERIGDVIDNAVRLGWIQNLESLV